MALTTADLRDWLERKYDMYFVEPRPLYGTYGQIWFLNARGTHQIPEGFAVKTVAPERVFDVRSAVDADYLRREFRIWLSLPPTANVLPALGFDVACLHEVSSGSEILLPVMRMPRMAGSLQEWIDLEQPIATADRLLALAQAVNGLMFMYENGIQGHGDLKPQNILFEELSMRFALSEGGAWPSVEHPWRIRIADLGWADAWTDLGFSNKALRQYLAPERLDGHVEPKLSDIFAMGLITAELLQGRHPAPNLPKVLSSDGKWSRWVRNGPRDLDGIASHRVRELINSSLEPDPSKRPAPEAFLSEVCEELRRGFQLEIEATLDQWRRPASLGPDDTVADEHRGWAATQSVRLGSDQARMSQKDLEHRISQIHVSDLETGERWVALSEALVRLLEAPSSNDRQGASAVRAEASQCLSLLLRSQTPEILMKARRRADWPAEVRLYERLSEVLVRLARLAHLEFRGEIFEKHADVSSLAVSALAFGFASEARAQRRDASDVEAYLALAIRLASDEPTAYYFRVLWRFQAASISRACNGLLPTTDQYESWQSDLDVASALDPDWKPPRDLLIQIRAASS